MLLTIASITVLAIWAYAELVAVLARRLADREVGGGDPPDGPEADKQ